MPTCQDANDVTTATQASGCLHPKDDLNLNKSLRMLTFAFKWLTRKYVHIYVHSQIHTHHTRNETMHADSLFDACNHTASITCLMHVTTLQALQSA